MSLIAVLIGGAIGTGLRLLVDTLLPHGGTAFPIGTLIVNVVGSFLLAVLVARVWPVAPGWVRAGLGPGLLGSFTTFSALAVSTVELTVEGVGATAVLYVAASIVVGLAAAGLGLRLGAPAAAAPPPMGIDE
ncbi:MAG: CrcB family protein [Pseudolysinimonas sp.]|uniref:fluoride efflux transporter FluC n=1 Tax=Pseudolysinimonas sp. TaxID=2680009 RepID=UPI0032642FEE